MRRKTFSVLIFVVLLTGILTSTINIQPVKASGTIYIRADGSVDPPTAPIQRDGDYYTLTDNITSSGDGIVVERDNIIMDGNGCILEGNGSGHGLYGIHRNNVTIKNTKITTFDYGIWLYYSSNNSIIGNTITDNWDGVILYYSSNNSIIGNTITNNHFDGISLGYFSDNSVSGNTITANNAYGIRLQYSSNNSIIGNTITNNHFDGIGFSGSSDNIISGNTITANNRYGIKFESSSNNTVSRNTITANNDAGFYFYFSSNNSVSGNTITNDNGRGIWLQYSNSNSVSGNTITNHWEGIRLDDSSNSKIYHNNFIDNTRQAYVYVSSYANVWDNGCEGNYWSDYEERYPNATEINNSGIWDTPYVIDENNRDNYPLMNPYWLPGDVNHDLKIDIYDVVRITGVYGSEQGDPNWNCHSDIAEPYGIINIYDVVTCTKDYRKEYTP